MLCFPSPSSSRIASVRLRVLLYQNCSSPPRSCAFSRSALACLWFLSRLANTASKYKHLDTSDRALSSWKERDVFYTLKIHHCYSYFCLSIFYINLKEIKSKCYFPKDLLNFLVTPYGTSTAYFFLFPYFLFHQSNKLFFCYYLVCIYLLLFVSV